MPKEIKYLRETPDNWSRELYEMTFEHKDASLLQLHECVFQGVYVIICIMNLVIQDKTIGMQQFFYNIYQISCLYIIDN